MIWLSAIFVGLFLGILGGGGSILVVPALTYLFELPAKEAIASSLVIVGITSLIGVFKNYKVIDYKAVIIFGFPAMIGTFLGAKVSIYVSSQFQMLLFASVMLMTAAHMYFKKSTKKLNVSKKILMIEGIFVGILTGLIGIGGGFLIVPVLYSVGISLSIAIPSSLLIISIKSLFGALGYMGVITFNWILIFKFAAISIIALFLGLYISKNLKENKVKKIFSIFLVIISVFIITQNL